MTKIKEETKQLESLLNKTASIDLNNIDESAPANPEPIIEIDMDDLEEKCKQEAQELLLKSISNVFTKNQIRSSAYLKNKIKIDVLSLSGMIYQLKVNTIMQKSLVQQVALGNAGPKNYETFTKMSQAIAELNKQMLATVEAIKLTYKDIKNDIKEKEEERKEQKSLNTATGSFKLQQSNDGSIISRGTQDLLDIVKKRNINNDDVEDIESY